MLAYTHYSIDSRVRREAEALAARGDQVDMISLIEEGVGKELNGVRFFPISLIRYRGSSNLVYMVQYFIFFIIATVRITRLHMKHRYQVIQVHTMPDFMVFATLIPKLMGAKIILDVHDLMPELYASKFRLSLSHPVIRFITWIELISIGFAHQAIAVHVPHRNVLIAHGNPEDKLQILLNVPDLKGLNIESTTRNSVHDTFNLLDHGTIAKRHGLEIAIDAVAELKDEIPSIRLSIIGAGDDRRRSPKYRRGDDLSD